MIPVASLSEITVSGINPEAAFVERWADRKARRADEVKALAKRAREARKNTSATRTQIDREERARLRAKWEAAALEAERIAKQRSVDALAAHAASASLATPAKRILAEVAAKHELAVADITGPRRLGHLVKARQEAMWRTRQETTLSLPAIGRRFGGRDHTTALHGIRQHQKRVDASRRPPQPVGDAR